MVREQMPLIQEIQSETWWDDVTTPMLESARKRLRLLVQLIEKAKRQSVYTDFEDRLGNETPVELPGFGVGTDFERFRAKARQFLRQQENHHSPTSTHRDPRGYSYQSRSITSSHCCEKSARGRLPEARPARTSGEKPGPRPDPASMLAPACRTAYC